jgi:glycosyltransferase involved in cell wall biosynthesis
MASTNEDNRSRDDSVDRPLRVCFVVLDAYPAIDSRVSGGIGGIETRSWLLARALSQQADIEVSFLVRTSETILKFEYDGVQIVPVYDRFAEIRNTVSRSVKRKQRFPWLSFKECRIELLWQLPVLALYEPFRPVFHAKSDPVQPVKLFSEMNTDILACFGVNVVSAAVIASAKAAGKKSVLFIASDIDLDERYTAESDYVNIYHSPAKACHYSVENADQVIVQTPEQLKMLEENFGRSGELMGNPIDLEEWDHRLESSKLPAEVEGFDRYVLWVGRAERNQKQPQLMPELARLCPDQTFLMIMNPGDEQLAAEVRQSAPANLKIIDRVPFPDMPAVYRHAVALVNTSDSEGFPNTFLQAAASGVPVASFKVCEEFLEASKAGVCAQGSMEQLGGLVQEISIDKSNGNADSARDYICQHHDIRNSVSEVAKLLKRL